MPERDCTDSCLDTLCDEIRPDSPESFSNMPSHNEYTQSFLDFWLSELGSSTPRSLESIGDLDEVLNQLPCGQSLPDEIVTTDDRHVYKPVSRRLMAHARDPVYEGKYVYDEDKFADSTVNMGEPHSPARSCYFAGIIPDPKPLQEFSLSHSTVLDLTVTDSHPEILMPPLEQSRQDPKLLTQTLMTSLFLSGLLRGRQRT